MSIQSEIDRISGNIAEAYSAVEVKGGQVPEAANSENLAAAVASIPSGPQLTAGRGVTISADGKINVDLPSVAKTQEEYDALPVAEKNSDTLFILPGDMPGAVTMDQVNAAIDAAITGAMEEAY